MEKRLVLIKGFAKTNKESNTMDYFLDAYVQYFMSNAGGAWLRSEIIMLNTPTVKSLVAVLGTPSLEFILSVFIGHGGAQNSVQLFQLNKAEVIEAGQFIIDSAKQLLIFESCRSNVAMIPTIDLSSKPPKFQKGGVVRKALSKAEVREVFKDYISSLKNGYQVYFACDISEVASNFIFTKSLLSYLMNWHSDKANHLCYNSVGLVNSKVRPLVNAKSLQETSKEQRPQVVGTIDVPLVISRY